ncbi:unannotated protein [freshwater metagenome]|uniref:Unannotated protein n=1 Tax=freshwater metagenome TaxID=449393 RepID=A0A6J6ZPP5_9ZZZZ|nr:DegT/DnrJ/EryC1/StrS family aminotransferase [Actinomycetota bacterium]
MKYIPVAKPVIGMREMAYVFRALIRTEISGYSKQFIPRFESEFAEMCDSKFGVSVNSGTSAIHLALAALGVGSGDEVLVSAYTNMATFFPVLQLGGNPIPIDVDPITFNMDPQDLRNSISKRTKAIIVVHIFGHPAPMEEIISIAETFNIPIIEDCAEAHGAKINGKTVGSFGTIGCFSFYANKLMTTGEGGMLTTNSETLRDSMKSIASLSFGKTNKFVHERDGYNFRLTNIQAAIGIAQLHRLSKMIRNKRKIAARYNHILKANRELQLPIELPGYTNVYWMYHLKLLSYNSDTVDKLIARLNYFGIEARRGFVPYSDQLNVLHQFGIMAKVTPFASVAGESTLYLPSGPSLSNRKIKYIAKTFLKVFDEISQDVS